jgi:hypothetical protein
MPNALIYSPDLDGHRQVHLFVYAHILEQLHFKIFIAGNLKQIISNSFYIDKLKKNLNTNVLDTSKYTNGGIDITLSEFLELQNTCKPDLTIFAEADNHIPLFVSQISKKKRFSGKIVGLFLRPFYYYAQNGLYEKLRYLKHLPSKWKNDDQLFHEVFLRLFPLLDVALYLDENFVAHHRFSAWIPDMFQQYAELIVKDESSEQRGWIEKLEKFKERNNGRFLFFYFGTSQFRRGYDILLKMAQDYEACFIHCGLRNRTERFVYDVDELRSSLDKDGRLFETDLYIEDPLCIEYFFKSVSHLILPYRKFYGSSGVMLQALGYGIPILAPGNGIIGYWIEKYHLGITYDDRNESSLYPQFDFFKKNDPKIFENNIKAFMSHQSTEQLKGVLLSTFAVKSDSV